MLNKLLELPEEIKQFIWLFLVSAIGGFVGFVTKNSKTLHNKTLKQKVSALLFSMLSSMFIAYLTYELMRIGTDKNGLAVAVAGFMAYVGTDMLLIVQERLIEKVKSKIDAL